MRRRLCSWNAPVASQRLHQIVLIPQCADKVCAEVVLGAEEVEAEGARGAVQKVKGVAGIFLLADKAGSGGLLGLLRRLSLASNDDNKGFTPCRKTVLPLEN
jgi:hypothetical protein